MSLRVWPQGADSKNHAAISNTTMGFFHSPSVAKHYILYSNVFFNSRLTLTEYLNNKDVIEAV